MITWANHGKFFKKNHNFLNESFKPLEKKQLINLTDFFEEESSLLIFDGLSVNYYSDHSMVAWAWKLSLSFEFIYVFIQVLYFRKLAVENVGSNMMKNSKKFLYLHM